MSRTPARGKAPGFEYWSRRYFVGLSPGRFAKKLTHRRERREPLPVYDWPTKQEYEQEDIEQELLWLATVSE